MLEEELNNNCKANHTWDTSSYTADLSKRSLPMMVVPKIVCIKIVNQNQTIFRVKSCHGVRTY